MLRERGKMHIYMLKTVSFSLSCQKKKPSGNIILLGAKNHIAREWKPISQSIDAWAQFQVHLVYTYRLMYQIPTLKCMNPSRKPLTAVVPMFRPSPSTPA